MKEDLHKTQLVAPDIREGFLSCRVASGGAGADGPLRGLLLGLLFGVPGPAVHHVQGRTLLLHWTVSSLRRYQLSLTMRRKLLWKKRDHLKRSCCLDSNLLF